MEKYPENITEAEKEGIRSGRKDIKYDGNSNAIVVDNPNYFNEEGNFKKHRNKPTNLTPKKKKRKR